ncbi:MAG: OmpH family outer membrane protein [Chlorobi bacterium]|nr:OmpH family outer membrane protein [Chlorobiota bacterium]
MKKFKILLVLALMGSVTFAQKFAFVDTEYILKHIPAYETAQEQLDNMSVQWQKEIEVMYAEIDKMYKDYQAEKVLLTEDLKTKKEDEIINKEKEVKELQKKRFGTEGDLYKKRQELVKPIQDDIFDAIKQMASDGNYAIIFDSSSGANMLYTDPKYDKSDEILDRLGFKN